MYILLDVCRSPCAFWIVLPAFSGTQEWFTSPVSCKLGPHGLLTEFLLEENEILIYES